MASAKRKTSTVPSFVDVDTRGPFLVLTCRGCGDTSGLRIDPDTMAPNNDIDELIDSFVDAHNTHEPEDI